MNTFNKQEVYNQISLFSAYAAAGGGVYGGPYVTGLTAANIIADQNNFAAFDMINHAKVEVDNATIRDVDKKIGDLMLVQDDFNEGDSSPITSDEFNQSGGLPADRIDIVFDKSDLPTDGLVMQANGQTVKDFRITATIGSPGQAAAVAANKTIQAVQQIYGAIEK